MPPGSECSSTMLLLRNNRRPQSNTRDHWHHYVDKIGCGRSSREADSFWFATVDCLKSATQVIAALAERNLWNARPGSLRLDVGCADYLRPFSGIRLDDDSKLLRGFE